MNFVNLRKTALLGAVIQRIANSRVLQSGCIAVGTIIQQFDQVLDDATYLDCRR
jgi:hypothetical protein